MHFGLVSFYGQTDVKRKPVFALVSGIGRSGLRPTRKLSHLASSFECIGRSRSAWCTKAGEGLVSLLRLRRETAVRWQRTERALVRSLHRESLLMNRVEQLMTIHAVGPVAALSWALEVGDVQRFSSIKKGVSYQRRKLHQHRAVRRVFFH
jgi:hypothetical protein